VHFTGTTIGFHGPMPSAYVLISARPAGVSMLSNSRVSPANFQSVGWLYTRWSGVLP